MKNPLIIATRESPLALCQAELIKTALQQLHPQLTIELLGITTKADRMLDVNLVTIGGKGWFVKELEEALLDGRADIAVHSMKDVPMELPPGLLLPVMTEREDVRDAFVANHVASLNDLPAGAKVGTSSLRRQTQLAALRPDLIFDSLRGNINTRLKRLDEGRYDAIILASAGLRRMFFNDRITEHLSVTACLPAAGQGALGIECRAEDENTKALIAGLNHAETADCVNAERALCRHLGGGCQVPVAAFATLEEDTIYLRGLVANQSGSILLKDEGRAPRAQANQLGIQVAESLILQGARAILDSFTPHKG